MATSAAQICNIALLRIGQRQQLTSLDDNSSSAQACKTLFEPSRDEVLSELAWGFATRRSTLALVANATRSGWGYVYALPADCVAPQRLYSGLRNSPAPTPYTLEGDAVAGTVLLTDLADAELIYTWRHDTILLWPALFVDALAWKLAADLALAVPVKTQVGLAMATSYLRALGKAQAADVNRGWQDAPPESSLISGR